MREPRTHKERMAALSSSPAGDKYPKVVYNPTLGIYQVPFVEKKEGSFLVGEWGGGSTPEKAVLDLWNKARSGVWVANAYRDDRVEFYWHRGEWHTVGAKEKA